MASILLYLDLAAQDVVEARLVLVVFAQVGNTSGHESGPCASVLLNLVILYQNPFSVTYFVIYNTNTDMVYPDV